jgi:hypothetical protein
MGYQGTHERRRDTAANELVADARTPGKATLTGALGLGRTRAPATVTAAATTPQERSYDYTIPLTQPERDAARAGFETYKQTGVFPVLPEVRQAIVARTLQYAIPTDAGRAMGLAEQGGWHLVTTDEEFFRDLFETELPKRSSRAEAPPRRAVFLVTLTESQLVQLRGKAADYGKPVPTPGPTPVYDDATKERIAREDASTSGAFQWVWGMLQGDFNEDQTIGQAAVRGLLGLVPVVDQVLDVEDAVANLKVLIYDGRYDEFDPWFNLVATLIGAIPEVGSVIKPILKTLRRGVDAVPLGALRGFVARIADHAAAVSAHARSILAGINSGLQTALGFAAAISAKAKAFVERLATNAARALQVAAAKVAEVFADLERRLEALLARVRKTTRRVDDDLAEVPVRPTKPVKPVKPVTTKPVKPVKPDPTKKPDKPEPTEVPDTEAVARSDLRARPPTDIDASTLSLEPLAAPGHRNAGLYTTTVGGKPAFVKVLNQGDADDVIEIAATQRLGDLGVGPRLLGTTTIDGRRAIITEQITDGVSISNVTSMLSNKDAVLPGAAAERLFVVTEIERFGKLIQRAGIEVSNDLQFLYSPSAKRLYLIDAQKMQLLPPGRSAAFSIVTLEAFARDLRRTWGLPAR